MKAAAARADFDALDMPALLNALIADGARDRGSVCAWALARRERSGRPAPGGGFRARPERPVSARDDSRRGISSRPRAQRGFRWYAGVPCSFLTPFINYVLQDPSLHYVSMANEGDAVALIAGVALAGDASAPHGRGIAMMQNSGLGNAVSPLTSLTWTFRLPQLLIVTWRGQPGIADEPQHALDGSDHPGHARDHGNSLGAVSHRERADRTCARPRHRAHGSNRPALCAGHAEGQRGCLSAQARQRRAAEPVAGEARSRRPRRARDTAASARPSRQDALRAVVARTPRIRPCCWRARDFADASCTPSMIGPIISTWWGRWDAWCRWRSGSRWRARTCASSRWTATARP